jgi:hypothetical protein
VNALGTAVFALGLVTALTLAYAPMAVAAGALFGLMALLAAWARLREHPAAESASLAVSALRAAARATLELAVLNLRAAAGTWRSGSLRAFPGLRWSRAERAALKGKRSLRYLIEDVPRRRHETGGER